MIFTENEGVRLTSSEFKDIRTCAAANGHAIATIKTRTELRESLIKELSDERLEHMLNFMEQHPTTNK